MAEYNIAVDFGGTNIRAALMQGLKIIRIIKKETHSSKGKNFVISQLIKTIEEAKNNKKINWVPKHFKYGRFLKSMEVAPDWCISRSRYWGSPVPVWECECGERYIPGSIAELETFSGRKITLSLYITEAISRGREYLFPMLS